MRYVVSPEELDDLPVGTVVIEGPPVCAVLRKSVTGWLIPGLTATWKGVALPAEILWRPSEGDIPMTLTAAKEPTDRQRLSRRISFQRQELKRLNKAISDRWMQIRYLQAKEEVHRVLKDGDRHLLIRRPVAAPLGIDFSSKDLSEAIKDVFGGAKSGPLSMEERIILGALSAVGEALQAQEGIG